MPRLIFLSKPLFPRAMEKLSTLGQIEIWDRETPPTEEDLIEKASRSAGLITMLSDPITEKVIESGASNQLSVISQMAVGYDNIAIAASTAAGIPIGHTPGALTETTADLAWALLMAAARRVVEADKEVHRGIWRPWGPDVLCGTDIYGSTLGLIGFGRIGQAVAARARGFQMRILYTQRKRDNEAETRTGAEFGSLEDLLEQSDFISLHANLNNQTRGMLGKAQFEQMKIGAILINTARGAMIDNHEFLSALKSGKLAAAGLDVFDPEPIPTDSPFLQLPQVVITQHIGSASTQTRERMSMMVVENIAAGLSGKKLPYCANPEVYANLK